MARVLMAVGVVVLAALLLWLRAETAAPSPPVADGDHAATARDDDDDSDAPAGEIASPAAGRRAPPPAVARAATPPAARPYDPWADPPPVDPARPRLDVDPPEDAQHVMAAAFRAAMQAAVPELRRCYRSLHPTTAIDVTIGAVMFPGDDGKPVLEPRIASNDPVTPELETCLSSVVASLELPVPEEPRPFHMYTHVRLTPDPAN